MKLLVSRALWRNESGADFNNGLGSPTHYEYRVVEIDSIRHDTQKVVLPADEKIVWVLP